jgi:polyisoprenoid-binding protein YceI
MRTCAFAVASLLVLFGHSIGAVAAASSERAIDPAASKAVFGLEHIFVSRVTGTIPIVSGMVSLSPDSTIPLGASAVLDATKVDTGDRDQSACIRSPDYFDVQRFPTMTFTSTKIVPSGKDAFSMDGLLTIHGVQQPEHLDVTLAGDASHPVYHAVGHIDRHAFGMKGSRLDPVIGGVVDVTLDISLK